MQISSSEAGEEFRPHLFEYRHDGTVWGIEIIARSPEDARQRMKALAWANYKGEVFAKIPVPNWTPIRMIALFIGRLAATIRG